MEISPETPPNPNLAHVPERDITTPSGRRLTLINPAYMTRQVFDFARQVDGPQGHITSLHPRHPENVPDAWERAALAAFRHDSAEHGEVQVMNNRRFYRLIRPFAVDEKCIRCHAAEGYQPGDIRGALSVAIPMDEFEESMRHQDMLMWIVAALLWLTGWSDRCCRRRCSLAGAFEDANRR